MSDNIHPTTANRFVDAYKPDALELEIFRYAMESVVDEIDVNITRTAFSPLIYEYKDYCTGFLTRDFKLLCQSPNSLPMFLADLGGPVKDSVSVVGEDQIEEGDILFSNFAAVCGQHLNNVVAAMPVFDSQGIAGYVAIRMHWIDVGGLVPGSTSWDARSILHEGFQLRGVRIVRRGRVVPELLATIQANTWQPEPVTGDLMAQIGACKLGAQRWRERLGGRWTSEERDVLAQVQFAASDRLVRGKVREFPDGEYCAECRTDDAGLPGSAPLLLKVKLIVDGDIMAVDLSGLPPQSEAPINTGVNGGAVSAMRCAFKSVLAPDHPADEGMFECLEVRIPAGTILSAVDNAPMGYWNATMPTMVDLFVKAVGERLPERVPAGHHGTVGIVAMRGRKPDGSWWTYLDTSNGGFGASADRDGYGPLKTICHGDNPCIPVELAEGRCPIRFHEHRLLREAGGRGLHRGGPGTLRTIEILQAGTVDLSFDRTIDPPWGLAGGEPGEPGGALLKRPGEDSWAAYRKISSLQLEPGTLIQIRNGGGGGWGHRELITRSIGAEVANQGAGRFER